MDAARYLSLLIWGLSVLMVYSLFNAARYGVRLAGKTPDKASIIRVHKRWAWMSTWVTGATVLVIDPTIMVFHLPYPWFFFIAHLPLLLFYGISLILALVFNGAKQWKEPHPQHPHRHNIFGQCARWGGLLTAITGDILVGQLLWPR